MKELQVIYKYSEQNEEVGAIKDGIEKLVYSYCSENDKYNLFGKNEILERKSYKELNKDVTDAILGFCTEKSGIRKMDFSKKTNVYKAFMNQSFAEQFNSIIVEVVNDVIVNSDPRMLDIFTNIENVDLGDSYTATVETKGLPIVQRQSYTGNVAYHEGITSTDITITPKPYVGGTQMDFIRFATGAFDFGKEVGRIAMAMLYAQYKLVVSSLYTTATASGTPFVLTAYNIDSATSAKEVLEALNSGAEVKAYATQSAFAKAGVIATTNYGFATQDDMIRNGLLPDMYGIKHVVLPNITDLSAPLNGVETSQLLIPSDKILLMSDVGSKPVTLVREDYVRVLQKEGIESSTNVTTYSFSQSFETGVITQAQYVLFEI